MLALLSLAAASPGDQSWAFRRCHMQCTRTGCASLERTPAAGKDTSAAGSRQQCSPVCSGGSSAGDSPAAPLALRLWRWDCAADCSYLCMWQVEASRPAGAAVQKYYGKWPFRRLGGMQEPASVLFSLLNLAAHAHCLVRFLRLCQRLGLRRQGGRRKAQQHAAVVVDGTIANDGTASGDDGSGSKQAAAAPGAAYPYAWLWSGYMLLSINAWLWSAAFHSRDTRLTERLDYFAAALLIFFNLFLSVVRVLRLRAPVALAAAAAPLALFLASHFRFMLFVLFDYGYHMAVCITVGAAQSLLWLGWAAATSPPPPGRRPLLAFVLALNACMALEVLDFPPLWHALDAHSLWHAATAPLVYLFYRFIEADVTAHAGVPPGKTD